MLTNNIFDFIGGNEGEWKILKMETIIGESIEQVSHLKIIQSSLTQSKTGIWTLRGVVSNLRYAEKAEKEQLAAVQASLGRSEATMVALIPIRKNEAWWALAQDERRKLFEDTSHHTEIGLKYLPAIARKLFHCRDIGEPFDFLTWFEYAPEHAEAFETLVYKLRQTNEWQYVDREIDIRLMRHHQNSNIKNWAELGE